MATDTLGRHRHPLNLNLALIVIAFILSTIFLTYMRLDPTAALAPSRHPISNKPDELNIEHDSMTITTGKHDKDKTGRTYPQLSTLPASLLPTPEETSRRLIILGDVHGHLDALEALLRKADFSSSRGDTVILAGDIVNKGPDSAGVVDLAMRIGAYGVRGNHDDRVLRAWEYLESRKSKKKQGDQTRGVESDSDTDDEDGEEEADGIINEDESGTVTNQDKKEEENQGIHGRRIIEEGSESDANSQSHKKQKKKGKGKKKGKKGKAKKPPAGDLATAKSLKPEHRAWLAALPLILRVGDLGPRYGEVIVVHAGLVPGIPLEDQDPEAVMNMRTLLAPSRARTTIDSDPEAVLTDQAPNEPDPANQGTDQRENKHTNPMIPSPSRDGTPWAKIWTSYQTSSILSRPHTRPTTVVYGHDAKAGLQIRKYTFGLDSGCGSDNALTGMIFEIPPVAGSNSDNVDEMDGENEGEGGGEWETGATSEGQEEIQRQHKRSRIRHRLVSVPCA
ncbi:Metallo-dependent phosphatase [Xylaria arbuscula]|nr:Metallo-dependent phosphatase [Xylaria arbuscula]